MKFLFLCFVIVGCAHKATTVNMPEFREVGTAKWDFQESSVSAKTGSGFLVTKESYQDFHLTVEFQAAPGTNSGVFFRCSSAQEFTDRTCYEANIFDTRPDQTYRTGGLVQVAAPSKKIATEDGYWHKYEVITKGPLIQVLLDGIETVKLEDSRLSAGPIALQFAQGGIRFRDLKIVKK